MYCDFHLHTAFSEDCHVPAEEMVQAAIEKGIDILCMTDHMDMDFPYPKVTFDLDTDAYYKEYLRLRELYQEKLDLRFGVELGLQEHLVKEHTDYVNRYPFDFIIGSLHLVNRIDPWYPDYFEGRSDEEAFTEYFKALYDNVKAFHDYDVLGHLDYIVRYSPNKNANYSYEKFKSLIDPTLEFIVSHGIGLELNTGSIKSGLDTTNPVPEILKKYRQLGGEIITLGSDAHVPQYAGFHLKEMQELLKSLGFTHFTVFKERKPQMIPLD